MNMKRKIRKAFQNATPNILDRLSPAQPTVISMNVAEPEPVKSPTRKERFREFVAVAAALALIIGSLGSGIQFIRQHIQTGDSGNLLEPGDYVDGQITEDAALRIAYSQVDNSLSGTNFAWFCDGTLLDQYTDEIVSYYVTLVRHPYGDFDNNEYKTFCISATSGQILDVQDFNTIDHDVVVSDLTVFNDLWNLILENGNTLSLNERLDRTETFSFVQSGELFYLIKIHHGGFEYRFVKDYTGKLHSINISITEDHKEDQVIAKNVALEIVCLAAGIEIADGQSVQILLADGGYRVTFVDDPIHSGTTYIVDAHTGEIVDDTSLSLVGLRDIALGHFSLGLDNCWEFVVEPLDDDLVRVTLWYDGCYVATIRLSDGVIVDDYVLMAGLPVYMENEVPVNWQAARDTALQNCGLSLDALTSMFIGYDEEHQIYEFIFGAFPEEHACCVDAVTGQLTNPVADTEYIGESAAWDVMVMELPEDVKTAFLAANDIQTACSLIEKDGVPCYYLWLSHDVTNYEAFVDAKTGELLSYEANCPDPEPLPPDGNIGEALAVKWAIDALVGDDDVKVTVLSCNFVNGNQGDYYLVCYFAGGCYYRVAIGAYGAGHLWHEGYDYEDTLNSFSEKFSSLGTWENMALTHTYEGPDQLQLAKLFYNGVGEQGVITAEELALLQEAGYPGELDIIRLPADKMEEILGAYFGCTVEDASTEGLVYLESADCYYLWHSDALAAERFYALGLVNDGVYHMYYILQDDSQVYALTFEETEGGILIYNNLAVDLFPY